MIIATKIRICEGLGVKFPQSTPTYITIVETFVFYCF